VCDGVLSRAKPPPHLNEGHPVTPLESREFNASSSAPLERALKDEYPDASWNVIRRLVDTHKVTVDGMLCTDPRAVVRPAALIAVRMNAPRPKPGQTIASESVMYCDRHVLVVNKPAGINSVRADDESTSFQEILEQRLRAMDPGSSGHLHVVHRLDKVTSGVMIFARTAAAQSALKDQFRAHTTGRIYDAIVHGHIHDQTLSFHMVRDRGDGIRGVTRTPGAGYHSITHVAVVETLRESTWVECRLETGRTHQIRIHLSHIGHPLVGEPLYTRDFGGTWLAAPRTLLHARALSFTHPVHRKRLSFVEPCPNDFQAWIEKRRTAALARPPIRADDETERQPPAVSQAQRNPVLRQSRETQSKGPYPTQGPSQRARSPNRHGSQERASSKDQQSPRGAFPRKSR
jgi:23S rRNA pseudouridine1911/1915/1917 synthase